jgi:hypothetical protein
VSRTKCRDHAATRDHASICEERHRITCKPKRVEGERGGVESRQVRGLHSDGDRGTGDQVAYRIVNRDLVRSSEEMDGHFGPPSYLRAL